MTDFAIVIARSRPRLKRGRGRSDLIIFLYDKVMRLLHPAKGGVRNDESELGIHLNPMLGENSEIDKTINEIFQ